MSNVKLAYAYGSLMAKTATGVGALVGGAIGAAGAGEDNRAAGAALGATLGTGINLAGVGYTFDPVARGLVGDQAVNEAISRGNQRFANRRFMNNPVGRYLGRTTELAISAMSPEAQRVMQDRITQHGKLKAMFAGGKGVTLGQVRKGILGIGAGLAAAGLARAGLSGSEPEPEQSMYSRYFGSST